MNFEKTGMPDKPLFRSGYMAGWRRYLSRHGGSIVKATAEYMRGPVAMARMILDHGGDCRQTAAAAALAGPAVFSASPETDVDVRLHAFAAEIAQVDDCKPEMLPRVAACLSGDARIFLQAMAIFLLEDMTEADVLSDADKLHIEALQLYSAARGAQDIYAFDTRFEIAAMKITTLQKDGGHLWAKSHARNRAVA